VIALVLGCSYGPPELPELVTTPLVVEVEDIWKVPTDARMPTDLAALDGGGFAVLDSYGQRLLLYDAETKPVGAVTGEGWGTTIRAAASHDGQHLWLAVPEGDAVVAIDRSGAIVRTLPLELDEPISLVDLGAELVVGTRNRELAWVSSTTGAVRQRHAADADAAPLGVLGDLVVLDDGTIAAVDTLRSRVHRVASDGTWLSSFGYFGDWIGTLSKPKSIVAGPGGTLLVGDSAVRGIQLFEEDGRPLGAVAEGGVPLALPHVIALSGGRGTDRVLALDAATADVWGFRITPDALARARADAETRHLRHKIAAEDPTEGGLCFQCHDGIVRDQRYVWDPSLFRHPTDVVMEDPPPDLVLDDAGRMQCTTCHSPHPAELGHGEEFLRKERSQICIACHSDAAHETVVAEEHVAGSGHPVGSELVRALERRGGEAGVLGLPAGIDGDCFDCHAVHGARDEALARQAGDTCRACHAPEAAREGNHPVGRKVEVTVGIPLVEGENGCVSCHDLVGGSGDALLRETETLLCSECHDDPTDAAHDRVRGRHGIRCLGCHDPHGADDLLTATVSSQGCLACHDRPAHGHPTAGDVTCGDCHDAHEPEDVPACESCHETAHRASTASHGSVACGECHPVHASPPLGGPGDANPSERTCLACHGPAASGSAPRVAHWKHPDAVFQPDGSRWTPTGELPLYDAAGRVVARTQNGDLTCLSCHVAHPEDAGGDHLRRGGWEGACGACHGADALPLYRWFHEPERRSRP
jgi:predicted CXXCH cytochrome family protein